MNQNGNRMPGQHAGIRDVPAPRASAEVLADRIAAALVHREPGWRLPRRSALARRYSVSVPEIDTAIAELVRRSLIRQLPDGQLYRASPAEYLIPLEGIGGLATQLDPMGGEISCQARHVSQRDAPRDVAWALGVAGDTAVRIVRSVWAAGDEPAAICTAYLREPFPGEHGGRPGNGGPPGAGLPGGGEPGGLADLLRGIGGVAGPGGGTCARTVDLEFSPPQPSAARSLRLEPGQPAVSLTIRFDDEATRVPVALTVIILRPELFRVVIRGGSGRIRD